MSFFFFVFLFQKGSRETARFFQILVFSFQNENLLAAMYTDPMLLSFILLFVSARFISDVPSA